MAGGKAMMMADGGAMGAPAPIGGAPDDDDDDQMQAQGPGPQQDPDQDGDIDNSGGGASPVVKPESLNYHDDLHTCETCQYMNGDGSCSVLQMQVSPQGGCNAFESKGDEGAMPEGEGTEDNDMGTSGWQ
jgi:hypothetical protein